MADCEGQAARGGAVITPGAAELFDRLAAQPPDVRREALQGADVADAEMVAELLDAHDRAPEFLLSPTLSLECEPARPVESDLGPGSRVAGFTLVREVGRGGMGVVYEAEQDRPRRRVALKMMRPGFFGAAERAAFRREAEILGRLNHPNIAAVFGAGADAVSADGAEHRPYIAMEFVDGEPITAAARTRGLGLETVIGLMATVCDAAAHAHERGVIHRDLSPSNILVDSEGRVKVVDFGVARLIDRGGRAESMAATQGHVFGKWAYMAPEQIGAEGGRIDARADVFALGAVLFELASGRAWVDATGRTPFEMIRLIERCAMPEVSLPGARRGRDLAAVIHAAMHRDRARRYQSAGELGDELRRWLGGVPVLARRPSRAAALLALARRNRAASTAVAAAALALILGIVGISAQALRASRAERETARTLNEVIEQFVRSLDQSRAGLSVRAGLLARIRPQVDALASRMGSDPAARLAVSRYYLALAQVVGYPFTPNLGRFEEAQDALARAVRAAAPDGLLAERDEEAAYTGALAVSLQGAALSTVNRVAEALGALREVDRAAAAWEQRSSRPARWALLRSASGFHLAQALLQTGLEGEALALLSSQRASAERASGFEPEDRGRLWHYAARVAGTVGDTAGVLDDCRRACGEYSRIPVPKPLHAQWHGDVHRYAATSLRALGRLAEAERELGEAMALFESSEALEEGRSDLLGIRAIVLLDRAAVRAALGDALALVDAQRAVALRRERAREEPEVANSASRLAEALRGLAAVIDALRGAGVGIAGLDAAALAAMRDDAIREADGLAVAGRQSETAVR